MKNEDYYIGGDPGTGSFGWAVTDTEYNLLNLRGKDSFGAHLYNEGNTAKERRTIRTSKRRINRRKYRIYLLNQLLAEPINQIDKTFFLRLQESNLHVEDKSSKIKYPLFGKKNLEKTFYKKYPTIWDLRLALCNDEPEAFSDIRNIYFALHHIIKYRGNFLTEGSFDVNNFNYTEVFDEFNANVTELCDDEDIEIGKSLTIPHDLYEPLYNEIGEDKSINDKKKAIKQLTGSSINNKLFEAFYLIAIGSKYTIDKLGLSSESSIELKKGIKEDEIPDLLDELEDYAFIFKEAKQIYDHFILKKLLGENPLLSESMAQTYKNHRNQLKIIKRMIHDIDEGLGLRDKENSNYFQFFKDKNNKAFENYNAYVNVDSLSDNSKNIKDTNKLKPYLKKFISEHKNLIKTDDPDYLKKIDYIDNIEEDDLLPLISVKSTSLIPHQLHELELKKILVNAEKHFPSIFNHDLNQKILQLFRFRVPYYCGPLDDRSKHSNVERKSYETITPWNFDEIIDKDESRRKFMNNLTSTCPYLHKEKVLPRSSLIYEEYIILDRLNTMLVNGAKLSFEEKKQLFRFIHESSKTSIDKVKKFLSKIKNTKETDIVISGINPKDEFTSKSYSFYVKKLKSCISEKEMEDIIRIKTIYVDQVKDFKEVIKKNYPNLTNEQINTLAGLQTTKWARMSGRFLNGICAINSDEECGDTILGLLRNTNENFQQILNNKKYRFAEAIAEENLKFTGQFSQKEQINEIFNKVPPKGKKSINKAVKIIDEIVSVKKVAPKKIFIEVTRQDDAAKKETTSRRDRIKAAISEALKNDAHEYGKLVDKKQLLEELETVNDFELKTKHVYLYFCQLGIDLYTGKKIDLEDVLNSEKYDTDHIVPQSLIKDDSLDNLVLVDRTYNQRIKQAKYPIPIEIRNAENQKLWFFLKEKSQISDKKYNNLIRQTPLSESEINSFVSSQLNAVNYSNIALRDILQIKYPQTEIIFSKAHYPSYLRKHLKIAKLRGTGDVPYSLNDTHHAVDAYLNIVAGDILHNYFSDFKTIYAKRNNIANGLEKDESGTPTFNMEKVLEYTMNSNPKLKEKIQETCFRHTMQLTYEQISSDAKFYDQNILAKGKKANLYPIHTGKNIEFNPYLDVSKYGGYNSTTTAYFYLISYIEKKKTVKKLICVKNIEIALTSNNEEKLKDLLVKDNELQNCKDLRFVTKICCGSKIYYKGCLFRLRAKNANQLKLDNLYPTFLDNKKFTIDNNSSYMKFAINHLDRLENVEDDEIAIKTSLKENIPPKIISKERNYQIFKSLINHSKMKCFDEVTYIKNLREIDDKDRFKSFSLKQEIEIIIGIMSIFYKPDKTEMNTLNKLYEKELSKNCEFKPSNEIKGPFVVINESLTGLYWKRYTY